MGSGPNFISVVQRCGNVHIDSRILLRRASVALEYAVKDRDWSQVEASAQAISQLMAIYETECPSDQELYELDQWLITARRAIAKLFGPPDGPAAAGTKRAA